MTAKWSEVLKKSAAASENEAIMATVENAIEEMATTVEVPDPPMSFNVGAWRDWLKQIAEMFGRMLVTMAENLIGAGQGATKKELVIAALEALYLRLGLDVPYVPQGWELAALRWIAGRVIDKIVAEFNLDGFFETSTQVAA